MHNYHAKLHVIERQRQLEKEANAERLRSVSNSTRQKHLGHSIALKTADVLITMGSMIKQRYEIAGEGIQIPAFNSLENQQVEG